MLVPGAAGEPFHSGTLTATVMEALDGRSASLHAIGVPRRVIRSYGSAEDIDREVGLDVAGLRDRLLPLVA